MVTFSQFPVMQPKDADILNDSHALFDNSQILRHRVHTQQEAGSSRINLRRLAFSFKNRKGMCRIVLKKACRLCCFLLCVYTTSKNLSVICLQSLTSRFVVGCKFVGSEARFRKVSWIYFSVLLSSAIADKKELVKVGH